MDDADDLRLVALSGVDERLLLLDLGSVCSGKQGINSANMSLFCVLKQFFVTFMEKRDLNSQRVPIF